MEHMFAPYTPWIKEIKDKEKEGNICLYSTQLLTFGAESILIKPGWRPHCM